MSKMVIDEAFLAEIEALQTLLKNNVAGMFGGNHQSKSFGSSCEFADYRDYVPGDEISKIDWNVYARFDKLYQKLYLDERQMHTRIYIDASRSMNHGTDEKAVQAIRLAAAFAYLSVSEMDKVSVYAIHGGYAEEIISGMVVVMTTSVPIILAAMTRSAMRGPRMARIRQAITSRPMITSAAV